MRFKHYLWFWFGCYVIFILHFFSKEDMALDQAWNLGGIGLVYTMGLSGLLYLIFAIIKGQDKE